MIYLSCQPAIPRFAWEAEVYITNFLNMGVSPQQIHLVQGLVPSWKEIPLEWKKLIKNFPGVQFFFYNDTREHNNYQPSIQAHLLYKHWITNPLIEKEHIFFHDSDFVFTKPFDFEPFLHDSIWYLSDTISYIGAEYISSKGEDILDKMCEVADISKELVRRNQGGSGGAQKLMKEVPAQYWKDSYELQLKLWKEIPPVSTRIGKEKEANGESYHPLQHWTMSMWSELWTAWKYGRLTAVPEEFNFMFYTNGVNDWETFGFYHNAGVLGTQKDRFFKGKYDNGILPYGDIVENIDTTLAGYKYYLLVQEVGKTSCLK
jgi:hypothetical protein